MKKTVLFIAVASLSGSAFATNYGNFDPDFSAEANSSSKATASSQAIGVGLGLGIGQGGDARAAASGGNAKVGNVGASIGNISAQGGKGGAGGSASALGGAGGVASASNSLTFNTPAAQSVRYSGSVSSVPDLALGASPSTALCVVAGGVGGSGVGFGFGINGGIVDWNCVRMMVATSAAMPADVRAIAIEGIRADLLAHMPKRRETGSTTTSTVAFGD